MNRSMMSRLTAAAVSVALLAAGLAGCGGSGSSSTGVGGCGGSGDAETVVGEMIFCV